MFVLGCAWDLASHIVKTKQGHFEPEKYEDRYEEALKDIIRKKSQGQKIEKVDHEEPTNVVNLMDALRKSVKGGGSGASEHRKPARSRTPKKAGRAKTRSRKAS